MFDEKTKPCMVFSLLMVAQRKPSYLVSLSESGQHPSERLVSVTMQSRGCPAISAGLHFNPSYPAGQLKIVLALPKRRQKPGGHWCAFLPFYFVPGRDFRRFGIIKNISRVDWVLRRDHVQDLILRQSCPQGGPCHGTDPDLAALSTDVHRKRKAEVFVSLVLNLRKDISDRINHPHISL